MNAVTVERPAARRRTTRPTGASPEFTNVYREHLIWLLAKSEEWSEDHTEGAKRAYELTVKLGNDLQEMKLSTAADFQGVLRVIDDAVTAADKDQAWEWDRLLHMALDFAVTASGYASDAHIDARHVQYLSAVAHAQTALVRLMGHTADSWAAAEHKAPVSLPRLNGFTHQQVQQTLEEIGCAASTLRDFLVDTQRRIDEESGSGALSLQVSTDLHMARQSASLIGAMADHLGGGSYIGSAASWATMEGIETEEAAQ
ncbi:MAG: hypothetical protein QM777_08750 [Pseudorhodoferax sp.]